MQSHVRFGVFFAKIPESTRTPKCSEAEVIFLQFFMFVVLAYSNCDCSIACKKFFVRPNVCH